MLSKFLPYKLYKVLKSFQLKINILTKTEIKLIIGSGGTSQKGWIPSGIETINVHDDDCWVKYFKPNSINAILGEHIWEHLTQREAELAAINCYKYLVPGGYLRIAVPDGFHPDPKYLEGCGPIGENEIHKVMYNYVTLKKHFEKANFKVTLLEFYDEEKKFHKTNWDPHKGLIHRSIRFRNKNKNVSCLGLKNYTSLIIDAKKPKH